MSNKNSKWGGKFWVDLGERAGASAVGGALAMLTAAWLMSLLVASTAPELITVMNQSKIGLLQASGWFFEQALWLRVLLLMPYGCVMTLFLVHTTQGPYHLCKSDFEFNQRRAASQPTAGANPTV